MTDKSIYLNSFTPTEDFLNFYRDIHSGIVAIGDEDEVLIRLCWLWHKPGMNNHIIERNYAIQTNKFLKTINHGTAYGLINKSPVVFTFPKPNRAFRVMAEGQSQILIEVAAVNNPNGLDHFFGELFKNIAKITIAKFSSGISNIYLNSITKLAGEYMLKDFQPKGGKAICAAPFLYDIDENTTGKENFAIKKVQSAEAPEVVIGHLEVDIK